MVGDLLSHGIDLAQFVLGTRVTEVTAMTDTFITSRPIPLGVGVGHAAVAVSDERRDVENEDYVAALARTESGAVVTLESSRVAMGPRAEYVVEVYGTGGSVRWCFEHPQHLQVLIAGEGSHRGYMSVMSDAGHGDFARFQPGPGQTMSFDDSKVIEAKLFLESVLTGVQVAPSRRRCLGSRRGGRGHRRLGCGRRLAPRPGSHRHHIRRLTHESKEIQW